VTHWADQLSEKLRTKGNAVCVGLDPRWESLPVEFRQRKRRITPRTVAAAYEAFCLRILELVESIVPAVKPQMAFFEACGPAGLAALQKILQRARELGLFVILDGKRNDIASTAQAYADAAFGGVDIEGRRHRIWDVDAITVNPYLGRDSLDPFLKAARASGRGLFVLVRTSNPGAGLFQDLICEKRSLFIHVAQAVRAWAEENLGQCGFGDVGAVVGATHPRELEALRSALPGVIFLVPGYGAQGGTAKDAAMAFRDDGLGAIINSSRSILFPYEPEDKNWETRVMAYLQTMIAELKDHTPMRSLAKFAVKHDLAQGHETR
jgi:orotidine-5'-phosphate decarboxylase